MSILSLMLRGGILMYVLLLISIAAIGIIIEKYRQLAMTMKANDAFLTLYRSLGSNRERQDLANGKTYDSPLKPMLKKLYTINDKDNELLSQVLESVGQAELSKLEKGLGWLSTFSAIGPLVGFLGTVIGMVRVFMNIEAHSGAGVDISLLAGGIWEALLTTIGGLIVGILTIVFYNDLVQKLEGLTIQMQEAGNEFILGRRVDNEA